MGVDKNVTLWYSQHGESNYIKVLSTHFEYKGTKYTSKIKAIEASDADVGGITFHTFTPKFFEFPWNKEPSETYQELLIDRARQLRDKYGYLKFWFSGGGDSTTALTTFIKYGIFLDEIVVHRMALNDHMINKSNYELDDYAIPFLKKIEHLIPNTKITLLNLDKNYFDEVLGDYWLNNMSALDLRNFAIPKLLRDKGANIVCELYPEVHYSAGSWYSTMFDTSTLAELSPYEDIELFYTDEDCMKLHAKQLHMIKNYLKHNKLYDIKTGSNEYRQLTRDLTRTPATIPVSRILPKSNDISMFDNHKNQKLLVTATDLQKSTYKSMVSTKIRGKPLVRLFLGYNAGILNLGT